MKDAPIIILDEATANVDPENETELTEAIEALIKEKTESTNPLWKAVRRLLPGRSHNESAETV